MHYVVFQHSPKNSFYCSKSKEHTRLPDNVGIRDGAQNWLNEHDVEVVGMYECTVQDHKRQLVIYYRDRNNGTERTTN